MLYDITTDCDSEVSTESGCRSRTQTFGALRIGVWQIAPVLGIS